MKIFILSDAGSIHTKRWVKSLAENGCEIFLFGLLSTDLSFYDNMPNVKVYCYGFKFRKNSRTYKWIMGKVLYFKALPKIKQKINEFSPDIVHAHYASSFGLLGALIDFHPYIVSVWGSDVYDYPRAGFIYKKLLKYTLKKADMILSTSNVMAKETAKYTDKKIGITPFGVDTSWFRPMLDLCPRASFVVGNVKTLAPKYGIDVLIKSFARVVENNPKLPLQLRIAGDGPQKEELVALTQKLGIAEKVDFVGYILNDKLPEFYNSISVAVSLSVLNSESFGVVAVEAMSCECPVVTSDADGFTEVVEDGVTGFIVPKKDVEAAANAIQKFIDDSDLRQKIGTAGRERVKKLYEWNDNVQTMISYYKSILQIK